MAHSTQFAQPRLDLSRLSVWSAALVATVLYVAIVGNDVSIGPAPLKVFLLAGTLVAWWLSSERTPKLANYRFAVPVLLIGIVAPVVWSGVAAVNAAVGDSASIHTFDFTVQNASRFVYILLYFPLVDLARQFGHTALYAACLLPVVAICAVTWAIWIDHLVTGNQFDVANVWIFSGAVGSASEGFRVFIGNHIFLIPAFALLLALQATGRWSLLRVAGLVALLATAFLSHTRGIWLGLSIACASVLVVLILRELKPRVRPLIAGVAVLAVLAVVSLSALFLSGELGRPGFLSDTSSGLRVEQATPLWEGFKAHPVMGSGLGASLASGFQRSQESPWSFEDTYLQLLFQMGIVGLAVILVLPAMVIRNAGTRVCEETPIPVGPLAAVGGLAGIFVCTATNPLLMSSFGMLSIAMAVAVAEPVRRPGST